MKIHSDKFYAGQDRGARDRNSTALSENRKDKRSDSQMIAVAAIMVVIIAAVYFLFDLSYRGLLGHSESKGGNPIAEAGKEPSLSPFARYLLTAPEIGSPS